LLSQLIGFDYSEIPNEERIGMDTNDIKARLAEIQEQMTELHDERREASVNTAVEVGTDPMAGINLDKLSKWARRMREVNIELKSLADERRELRAKRRELNPCDCLCH
jgi:hypothetical protein